MKRERLEIAEFIFSIEGYNAIPETAWAFDGYRVEKTWQRPSPFDLTSAHLHDGFSGILWQQSLPST
jgi:hypothetical protein